MAAKASKTTAKPRIPKQDDTTQVTIWMNELNHPLKAEIEALRAIILAADDRLKERIKWAAPSYYFGVDLLTFNPRMQDKVHLIFHHAAIVQITSPLLEGIYKDRRMMYFRNMDDINAHQPELKRILKEYVALIEAAQE